MCALRHQHNLARVPFGCVRRADGKNAAQLAMRARLRAHRDAGHACELAQPIAQLIDNFQRALHRLLRGERVDIGKAGQPRDFFVEARIVLHCAAAEREKAQINAVILAAEAGVMPNGFRLCQADKTNWLLALETAEAVGMAGVDLGQVDTGRLRMADFEQQRLFEHQRAIARCRFRAIVHAIIGGFHRWFPAGFVGRIHDKTSSSVVASASISSSVVVSVTATSSASLSASTPG